MPLDGGGSILVDADPGPDEEGPVKAGRVADAVRELPRSLQDALAPVGSTARAVLGRLKETGADEVEVEFGVDLSAEAGVVITKSQASFHLKVRVLWQRDGTEPGETAGGEADAAQA
ncbi:CU044_2847 family protein [Streptomyces sp. SBT349]|uniref:CU044_2847 family protein n=1 Tax=Streptomyces sp. SBT349 TaxID=1580539 RepID=UPI001F34BA91|nr:CU044_2847 family protein [Streptomyces sp. SBT349]